MEIDTIIKALRIACEDNACKDVSDDMVLDCATRMWSTHFIQSSKNGKSGDGATEKQITTMKKLNIEFKDGINKKDASDLIGKKIESFN